MREDHESTGRPLQGPNPDHDELDRAGRALGAATVMLHSAIGERAGLSVTEYKALDILIRSGAVTAGELADRTGLTTGAVTGLVDRLEAAGFARRVKDPHDRRRVIVEPRVEELASRLEPIFAGLGRATREVYARYSGPELATILDFTRRMTEAVETETRALRDRSEA